MSTGNNLSRRKRLTIGPDFINLMKVNGSGCVLVYRNKIEVYIFTSNVITLNKTFDDYDPTKIDEIYSAFETLEG